MRGTLAALLVAGCTYGPEPWGYGARIDPGIDARWVDVVMDATWQWDLALQSCGGLAFHVSPKGHPVSLVPRGTDLGEADAAGVFSGDSIRILVELGPWERPVLLHELGHALGLSHVSERVDPDSIMNPSVGPSSTISQGDVMRALNLFNCKVMR